MDSRWIKDLVHTEQEMEESGMVSLSPQSESDKIMEEETHDFLQDVKTAFVAAATSFNGLKSSSLGTVKVYGIAKTKSDFMLFRNGYKLIFSVKQPGQINVCFQNATDVFKFNEQKATPMDETILSAQWGAFGDLNWFYQGYEVRLDSLVRYYLSQFVRESVQ